MPARHVVTLVLVAAHAALVVVAETLPDPVPAFLAGSVYLPLWPLSLVGLPVFGAAESGGWAAPSLFGWSFAALVWISAWSTLVAVIARISRRK